MDERFLDLTRDLHASLERLLAMSPVTSVTPPVGMPRSGVYLFSRGSDHLYVGRSNRLRSRIRRHGAENSKHNVAAFAFKMARQSTGKTLASYKPAGSRKDLLKDPVFAKAFLDAKEAIRSMEVRFVREDDQLRQALLEIYVAVVLGTPYNDFNTH
jgi:predicted GIY-YIG superfamily endonuclease